MALIGLLALDIFVFVMATKTLYKRGTRPDPLSVAFFGLIIGAHVGAIVTLLEKL